jgi:hypothetical protein
MGVIGDPFRVRRVRLVGGPCDGQTSIASHQTAFSGGELYVWGGDDLDVFVHALSAARDLPESEADAEFIYVTVLLNTEIDQLPTVPPPPPTMPLWRVNLWTQLIRNGLA